MSSGALANGAAPELSERVLLRREVPIAELDALMPVPLLLRTQHRLLMRRAHDDSVLVGEPRVLGVVLEGQFHLLPRSGRFCGRRLAEAEAEAERRRVSVGVGIGPVPVGVGIRPRVIGRHVCRVAEPDDRGSAIVWAMVAANRPAASQAIAPRATSSSKALASEASPTVPPATPNRPNA